MSSEKPRHEGHMEIVVREPMPTYNVARDIAHTYPGILTVAEEWLRDPPDTVRWILADYDLEPEDIQKGLEALGRYVKYAFDDGYDFEVGKAIEEAGFDSLPVQVQAAILVVIGQIVTCMAGTGIREAYVKGTPLTRSAEEFIRSASEHARKAQPSFGRVVSCFWSWLKSWLPKGRGG